MDVIEDRGPEATARLRFRRWTPADAPAILDMYGREEVYRYLGAAPSPVGSVQDARARIERWSALTQPDRGLWAVERADADDDAPIGTVLLLPLPRSDGEPSDVMEVGWHFHPDAWGNGYATEAAGSVVALARATGVDDLRAVVYPENAASVRVCERLGMVRTGPTREWYGVEIEEFRMVRRDR